jgi:glycosyltransferase 2 family protein
MRGWRVWLGLGISLVFLFIAFRGQDFGGIWDALRQAEYVWLLPALAAYFIGVWLRATRWHFLLRGVQRISARQLFPVVVIGYMANNVLPLRAGEVVRSYTLSTRHGVSKTSSLATIAVERIFDGLTMLAFMLVASLSIALTADLRYVTILASALFVVMLGVLFGFVLAPALRHLAVRLVVRWLPGRFSERVEAMANAFFEGLSILRRKEDLAAVAGTSLLAWLCEASMYGLVARGFNLHVSPWGILMVTAAANLATLIPSSPGYVGPFENGVLLVLSGALNITRATALSYAIVLHAALLFPVTLLGLLFWWHESLSWRDVRRSSSSGRNELGEATGYS